MKFAEFEAELGRGRIRSAYLMLGAETHLRQRAVDLLKSMLAPESLSLNYSEFDVHDTSLEVILGTANTFPMMSAHRLVLVHGFSKLDETGQRTLAEYLAHPNPTTILVLITEDLDRRTSLFKSLKRHAELVELQSLRKYELEKWAAGLVQERGYRLSPSSLKHLVELAGNDMQTLSNEIEKLLTYSGRTKTIPESAVDLLIRGSRQRSIFELTGALGKQDRARSLRLLADLLETGEPPLRILVMLARHFRQIVIVKELQARGSAAHDIAAAAQVPPFLQQEFLTEARRIPEGVAERMYLQLADADRRFKSTGSDPRLCLERIICSL